MISKIPPVKASDKTNASWVGCDVAKATFDAALWKGSCKNMQREFKTIPVKTFQRTKEGCVEFVNWAQAEFDEDDFRVVMEATGKYSTELLAWMITLCPSLAPAIINPLTARRFAESLPMRNKTDHMDARALSRYGAERQPVAFEPPTPEMAELRDLSRHRLAISAMRVAEESRAKESTNAPLVRRLLRKHIAQLQRDEAKIEEEMKSLIKKNADLKRDAKALDGVYGVGFITAASILAELGDLRRFHSARQLTAFAGVSPRHERSGTSVRKKGRMSKQGSCRVRRTLYMSALSVIRGQSDLGDFYRRLLEEKKTKMAAMGAVMRKLLVVMRAILISGEPYVKHYRKPVHNC